MAECNPATNAAKGLVNHLSTSSFASSSSSSAGREAAAPGQPLGRQRLQNNQLGANSQAFFDASLRPQIAGLQAARHPAMSLNSQSTGAMRQQAPQWASEFSHFESQASFGFEDAFAKAQQRGVPAIHHQTTTMTAATNYPSGPEWNQEFRPRMAYHNTIPMNSMSLNHTIIPQTQQQSHESEVLDREWSAQFAHVEETIVKGKERLSDEGVSSSIPVSSTHVHGDLDSWSHEFDNLSLREFEAANATTPSSKNWEQELANLDNDLESASTEEERQNLMKKMGDIWAELQQAEREEAGAASSGIHNPWDGGFEDFMNEYGKPVEAVDPDPVSAPWTAYKFEPENPFLQYPDAMAQGLRILESPGGSLSQAALAFEAAVQTSQSENSEAWMHLGKVQAENEKEEAAIAALQKSVQLDHTNLTALMALSVSYTNEGQELQAYATLNRWLTTKYPNIPVVKQDTNSYTSTYEIHESSTSRFIQAVQSNSGKVDPDLQLGLGVLFYNRSEYDKVIDCFSSALRVRSDDYLLWNRLGATLANSGRSEEAIEAYRRALELKPSFVRCRYNLGVSCINIGSYREAAEHLLGALSLHVVGDHNALGYVNVSENLWDTLRRTFIQMSRMDLAEMTQTDRDVNKYRKEFEF